MSSLAYYSPSGRTALYLGGNYNLVPGADALVVELAQAANNAVGDIGAAGEQGLPAVRPDDPSSVEIHKVDLQGGGEGMNGMEGFGGGSTTLVTVMVLKLLMMLGPTGCCLATLLLHCPCSV